MWCLAWIGDRYRIRGPLLLVNCALGLIGAPLLGWASQPGVRYFGCFLICASAQGGIPTCMAYQANNIRGHWKRAFCSATMIGFGGIGGIAGSLIFRTQVSWHQHSERHAPVLPKSVPSLVTCLLPWSPANTLLIRLDS